MRKSSVRVVLVGLAVALLAVGACGGDDDDNASSTNTTNKTDQTSKNGDNNDKNNEDGGQADPSKFCNNVKAVDQAFAGLADGSTEPKQLNKALAAVVKNSPEDIKADVQATVKSTRQALRGGTETTTPPATVAGATTWSTAMFPASVTDWMGANCQAGGGGGATTAPTTPAA